MKRGLNTSGKSMDQVKLSMCTVHVCYRSVSIQKNLPCAQSVSVMDLYQFRRTCNVHSRCPLWICINSEELAMSTVGVCYGSVSIQKNLPCAQSVISINSEENAMCTVGVCYGSVSIQKNLPCALFTRQQNF